ncbi:MAG: XdhC family protein, partial [Firmicutes bacterium]|nr:XdhC family protein [Bacillota bacterium]
HVHDADCLRMILPGRQPAYLGLIGSRRRVRGLFDMLEEEGFSREYMDRICTPIGLSIGSVTPEEIAIAIVAEIISYKRLPEKNIDDTRHVNYSDLDLYMMDYLAENHEPKAIVTVIQTKGSTPRGAGAKMAVSPRGDVTGSIGGGCSEGAVIRDAIDIIGTGQYKTAFIDMTGEVAESEGMVCGGVMYVLIEDGSEPEYR